VAGTNKHIRVVPAARARVVGERLVDPAVVVREDRGRQTETETDKDRQTDKDKQTKTEAEKADRDNAQNRLDDGKPLVAVATDAPAVGNGGTDGRVPRMPAAQRKVNMTPSLMTCETTVPREDYHNQHRQVHHVLLDLPVPRGDDVKHRRVQ
jgi:hypothetical protein